MCYWSYFDYYGESECNTNIYSSESNLFWCYFECFTNDIYEWNHRNVVARFE